MQRAKFSEKPLGPTDDITHGRLAMQALPPDEMPIWIGDDAHERATLDAAITRALAEHLNGSVVRLRPNQADDEILDN